MKMRPKRYLKSDVQKGAKIPSSLNFLKGESYEAVIHRDEKTWTVEFRISSAKKLLAANEKKKKVEEKSLKMLQEIAGLKNEINDLQTEVSRVTKIYLSLEKNNKQLLENIEKDNVPDRFKKSQKSHLTAAIERGTDFNKKPFQGGLAGL